MTTFDSRRFVVVTGKGGTGRTTLAICLGQLAAERGKRVIVCLTGRNLNCPHLPAQTAFHHVVSLGSGLDVINLSPELCREEYGAMFLKNRLMHRMVFHNRHIRNFLDAVPGLAEWAMLGKASYWALDDSGERPYDLVIFDAPATGHGMEMLRLPGAIVDGVKNGRMRDEAQKRLELLQDAARTAIVSITLPEELPVNEMLELNDIVIKRRLPLLFTVVNRVSPTAVSAGELSARALGDDPDGFFVPYRTRHQMDLRQIENIGRLRNGLACPLFLLSDYSEVLPTDSVDVREVWEQLKGLLVSELRGLLFD